MLAAGLTLPRSGTLVAVGGGTLGDVCTVAAHLLKRGVRLVQVPTTLLAAVDSSLGGKGAVDMHVAGRVVKNPVGVFHYAEEAWICPELFASLSDTQRREGALEAWKMVASLDAPLFQRLHAQGPRARAAGEGRAPPQGVRLRARTPTSTRACGGCSTSATPSATCSRACRASSCPTGTRWAWGCCARSTWAGAVGVTPEAVARRVETALEQGPGVLGRERTAALLKRRRRGGHAGSLLAADKKTGAAGELRMVLLTAIGAAEVRDVAADVWRALWPAWTQGVRP